MGEIAFLDGEFLPIAEAKVSVNDRGFLFGDGVYEVVRTYGGRIWALEPHLNRLARSLQAIELVGPAMSVVGAQIQEAHRRSGLADAQIYVQITRGAAPRSHNFPAVVKPTFLVTVRPAASPSPEERRLGVRIISVPDVRWGRCDIKSLNLLPNVLAKQKAKACGAFEAVFVRPDGQATEGSSTTLFAVESGRLLTREEGPHILSGITRRIVLDIAAELDVPAREGSLSLDQLLRADEVFLTGTNTEVLSVVRVNDDKIGAGLPGPVASRLFEAYRRRIHG